MLSCPNQPERKPSDLRSGHIKLVHAMFVPAPSRCMCSSPYLERHPRLSFPKYTHNTHKHTHTYLSLASSCLGQKPSSNINFALNIFSSLEEPIFFSHGASTYYLAHTWSIALNVLNFNTVYTAVYTTIL